MPINSNITDPCDNSEARLHKPLNLDFENPSGLVVYSEPRKVFEPQLRFLSADDGSIALNVDVSGAGTPENIHNGGDNSYWTASNLVGSNFDFASTTVANSGSQSIDGTATVNNDAALFSDGTSIDMSDYEALQGAAYITGWFDLFGAKEVEIQARNNGTNVGNSVNLSDYIATGTTGVWQGFLIPKADMGLGGQTVDELTITTIDIGFGAPPDYYLDDLLWVGTSGTPTTKRFSVEGNSDENSYLTGFSFFIADNVTEANALGYDKILGLSALTNGLLFQRQSGQRILFSAPLRQLSDLIQGYGNTTIQTGSDGTNTWLKIESDFNPPNQT